MFIKNRFKKITLLISFFVVIVLLGGIYVYYTKFSHLENEHYAEERSKISGESDSAFIREAESPVKDPALIDETDSNWIDVDGLREVARGKAVLIDETNRDWIGKRVVFDDNTVLTGREADAFLGREWSEEEQRRYDEKRWEETMENVTSVDFIKSIATKDSPLPNSVNSFITEVIDNRYRTPEVLFGSCAMVIFTKSDGSGWKLEKGQKLNFEVEQYPLETKNERKAGQKIIFGYVQDGKLYCKDKEDSNMKHEYSLTANRAGEYYMTILGADSIIAIKKGQIEIKAN